MTAQRTEDIVANLLFFRRFQPIASRSFQLPRREAGGKWQNEPDFATRRQGKAHALKGLGSGVSGLAPAENADDEERSADQREGEIVELGPAMALQYDRGQQARGRRR